MPGLRKTLEEEIEVWHGTVCGLLSQSTGTQIVQGNGGIRFTMQEENRYRF